MKTSINWLKNYIDIPWTTDELASKLTFAGLEVEGVENIGTIPPEVVVAEIVAIAPHPNADKLQVCQVNDGSAEPVQVVCGASNVAVGGKFPFARVGAALPGGFNIKEAKLRGVDSYGMLCSESELGVSVNSSGLMRLADDTSPGENLSHYFPSDTVIDWEVTPNRPDWLCHVGIAREIAAVADRQKDLRMPETSFTPVYNESLQKLASVKVQDIALCPRYTARVLRDVKIGPSPKWMQESLDAVGIRPINNVVDITNYVLMECGQPLHAFDYDLLADHTVIVRRAEPGETITTLDGTSHELTSDNLLIADTEKGIALAGVMGGSNSEINDNTTTVLLESAGFNPSNIRATSKKLGISTDSSYRFERGVDIAMVEFASLRAAYLLEKYADAKVVEGCIDVFDDNYTSVEVSCRPEVISQLLGVIIPHEKIVKYFRRLGFSIIEDSAKQITVEVPPYRHDIHREADLVEEVARIHGLKDIPARYVKAEAVPPGKEDRFGPEEETRAALLGLGLTETMTVSLISEKEASQQTDITSHDLIRVSNPLSREYEVLRPSLLPGLLQTVRHNIAHGCHNLAFFEVGNVHCSLKGHATQSLQAGIAMTGTVNPERFGKEASIAYDFYDLKGVVEGWLAHFGIVSYTCEAIDAPMFLAGNAAAFKNSNCEIARMGQLSPDFTKSMRIEHPLFVALVDIAQARQVSKPQGLCKPLPQFPTTHRDISMVAPKSLQHEQIMQTINRIKPKYIESVHLFDVYEDDEQLGANNRSLAYSLVFRHPERTLNDKEVNKMHEKLKEELGKKLPISFR